MATKKTTRRRGNGDDPHPPDPNPEGGPGEFTGESELIVITRPEAELRSTPAGVLSATGSDVTALDDLLRAEGVTLKPLFGASEDRLREEAVAAAQVGREVLDLSPYYRIDAPADQLEELAAKLARVETVESAYVKPPAVPAMWQMDTPANTDDVPAVTPDFTSRQGYLNAAPVGVDARHAWRFPGGRGAGVKIVDIEGAWRFSHEDLLQNQGGVVGGTPTSDLAWRNHGTAVIGEFGGDRNSFGVTGICSDANVMGVSIFGGMGSAAAIKHAADRLNPGDILLIELHRAGPRHSFTGRSDQKGYIAIEWWPDDYQAILYATNRGVIVVEAAGNGAENLADTIYDAAPAPPNGPFPGWWQNPYRRTGLDSGAILVGAGAPPPGTHGRNIHGPDRSRLGFSNYGPNVDTQGWGREVTTTGGRGYSVGDLQPGVEDEWYTDTFSGTSSASPIIVGALGCTQGALRGAGRALLTPAAARTLLRSTGSPQQNGLSGPTSQNIGRRPDLKAMFAHLRLILRRTVPLFRYWNGRTRDHFYTTNWRELGNGRHGYRYEGVQCHVSPIRQSGLVPLYRYWNPGNTDHFYTTNGRELGRGRYGYRYEGVQCYVSPRRERGTGALYRYWNARVGDHFYTTNWRELGRGRYGYRFEGVQCYVYTRATIPTPPVEEPLVVAPEFEPSFAESIELGAPEEVVMADFEGASFEQFEPGELMPVGEYEDESGNGGAMEMVDEGSFVSESDFAEIKPHSFAEAETFGDGEEANGFSEGQDLGNFVAGNGGAGSGIAITINVEGERQPRIVTS